MWRSVDFPAPEAPTRPSSSPSASSRSTPWSTSSRRSPTANDFVTPRAARRAGALISLVPQGVERVQAPGLERRDRGEEHHAHERAENDQEDRLRVDDRGDVVEQVDLAVEDLDAERLREPALDRVDLERPERAEERADARAEDPVPEA